MTYNELLKEMEVSAEERIKEIHLKANKEAEFILEKARADAGVIQKKHLENAQKNASVERNLEIYRAKEEEKARSINARETLFEEVFRQAGERLIGARIDPSYQKSYFALCNDAKNKIGENHILLHIDPKDETLARSFQREWAPSCEITSDLTCNGGATVSTTDNKIVVHNTYEARLKKARDLLRKDIFSILLGD